MEFITKHGHTLDIAAITDSLYQEAARNVTAKSGTERPIADDVEFGAELARIAIISWRTDTGEEPLRDKKPGDARAIIKRTAGLSEYVLAKAKEVKKADSAGFEIDSGN